MATYEDDHNLPPSSTSTPTPTPTSAGTTSTSTNTSPPRATSTTRRHRLNISDFFSSSSSHSRTSTPSTLSAPSAFATLAAAYSELAITPVMEDLLASLQTEAENPASSKGVPEGWTDGLERVARTALKKDDICAICNSPFLDDPYPLVVRLPCHEMHVFDLECIEVWLRLHSTCPLDRTDLLKKKEPPVPPPVEDDEEEWDDNYG